MIQIFRNAVIISILLQTLVGVSPSYAMIQPPEETEMEKTKQQRWDELSAEVNTWTDALGKGIDEAIKTPVIALNLLGVKTFQSCEGHLDQGLPHPWIEIDLVSPEIELLTKQYIALHAEARDIQNALQLKYPQLTLSEIILLGDKEELVKKYNEIFAKTHPISTEIDRLRLSPLVPLQKLLEKFYKNRPVHYKNMLMIKIGRLQSNDADFYVVRSQAKRAKRLAKYQAEMKAFGEFLKAQFFELN